MVEIRYNRAWFKQGTAPWCRWFADARLLWCFLFFVVVACVIADWIGCGKPRVDRLPIAGWALEIGGVVVVALGLSRKINLYGGESFRSRAVSWLLRFPMLRQDKVVQTSGVGTLSAVGATANITGEVRVPDDATIEDRVALLERQMRTLPDQLADLRQRIDEGDSQLRSEMRTKIDAIGQQLDQVKKTNERANIEDVGWEIGGLGWVIVGLTFTTVPQLVLLPPVQYLIGLFTLPLSCPL